MSVWHRAYDIPQRRGVAYCKARLVAVLLVTTLAVLTPRLAQAAVLSAEMDAEVAELHAAMEDGFQRIGNLSGQLRAAGAMPVVGGLPPAGSGPALGPKLDVSGVAASSLANSGGKATLMLSHEKIAAIRKLEADFAALQQQAFSIGRESQDNKELSRHPQINNYVQSLRDFKPRVKDMVNDLEKEVYRITGKQVEKPKKKKKRDRTIKGLSEEDIRTKARAELKHDSRPFRSRAMDLVSIFRERQLQMQDKQRDLQVAMDGPDWPKEDWPLSTSDAKLVGEAENLISSTQQQLVKMLEPFGGLARVHESGDDAALEQLMVLGEMISGYCELIERHVDAVKKVYRSKKKQKKTKSGSSNAGLGNSLPPLHVSGSTGPLPAAGLTGGNSLRESLLNFGGQQQQQQQPFAWLRNEGGVQDSAGTMFDSNANRGFQIHPNIPPSSNGAQGSFGFQATNEPRASSTASSFASLANLGSTLGGLASGAKGNFPHAPMSQHDVQPPSSPSVHANGGLRSLGDRPFGNGVNGLAGGLGANFPSSAQPPQAQFFQGSGGAFGGLGSGGSFGGLGAQHLPPRPRVWDRVGSEL
jgi:hypothetical protein